MSNSIENYINEVNRLMKYNRSKTIIEQTVPMNTYSTIKQEKEDGRYKQKNPCDEYVSPQACKSRFGQESNCPGSPDDFQWDNHCYYVASTEEGPKLLGLKTTDFARFVDVSYFQKFYDSFLKIGRDDDNFLKNYIVNYSSNNANLFKKVVTDLLEKSKENEFYIYEYISKNLINPGTLWLINSNNKVYNLKFKFYGDTKSSQFGIANIDSVKLKPIGYFSNEGEEFKGVESSDIRSSYNKFIDEWGTVFQVVGAIGFAIAGAYTGGATWALIGELGVELGLGLALARRALEKGDRFGAGMELLFGLLPLIKTSKYLVGISDDTITGIASKWRNSGLNANSRPPEILSFWNSLSSEEAEALARITRQEEHLTPILSDLVQQPRKIVYDLMQNIDNLDEAKNIITKFWNSSSGKELKLQGLVLGLDLYFGRFFETYDDKIKQNIENILSSTDITLRKEFALTFLNWTPEQIEEYFSVKELFDMLDMGTAGSETALATVSKSEGAEYVDLDGTLADFVSGECPNNYETIYLPGENGFNKDKWKNAMKYEGEWLYTDFGAICSPIK